MTCYVHPLPHAAIMHGLDADDARLAQHHTRRVFADGDIAYIHAHNAAHGRFPAENERHDA